jgi:hypothetical protein
MNSDLEVLESLKVLYKNGYPCSNSLLKLAIRNGHLESVKWLCKNGCSWDIHLCNHAADNGQLKILKWVKNNNFPWLKNDCMRIARQNNNIEIIEWFGKDYESESYKKYKTRMADMGINF